MDVAASEVQERATLGEHSIPQSEGGGGEVEEVGLEGGGTLGGGKRI